ncbi:hypothetical protein HYV10_03965, partial [Candidatus Dependentiae bacterium]|nr:hypothetical protein [Candidatus Dependentiae bacterium]
MEITSNKSLRSMKKRKTKSVKQIRVLNEQNTPVPIRLIQRYGLDGFNALINSPLLKTKFNNSIQDEQKALMTIKNFIEFLTTTDPNPIHYDIIRKVLQEKFPNLIHENSTIDEIARELISHCSILKAKLTTLNNEKNKRNNELFIWDQALLEIIHNTGNHGKTIASKGIKFRKKEYSNSLNNNEIDLSFWIKTQDTTTQYSHSSQAIQHLTEAIITDIIIKRTIWAEKNGPGTTNDVTTLITNLTVPGTVTTSKQADKVSLYKNTNSIKNEKLGYLDIGIPTFNSKVIESLIKTAQNDLESKTAVLLISFFIKEAYKQFKNRKNNEAWYDLKFPGRAKEIAARLNLNSNIDITRINNLIKFFDAFKCTMPSITSRLINVSECAHGSKFSPLGGWIVTVELPLRPLHIFNEKGSFIVPMLNNE